MTGSEIKRQVMEAMSVKRRRPDTFGQRFIDARAALAPCVILTAEEAEAMWLRLQRLAMETCQVADTRHLLALLTPNETQS